MEKSRGILLIVMRDNIRLYNALIIQNFMYRVSVCAIRNLSADTDQNTSHLNEMVDRWVVP